LVVWRHAGRSLPTSFPDTSSDDGDVSPLVFVDHVVFVRMWQHHQRHQQQYQQSSACRRAQRQNHFV
jgi:hypothetical protein